VAELDGPAQALREVGRPLPQVAFESIQAALIGRNVFQPDEQPAGDVDDVVGAHKIRVAAHRHPRACLLAEALPRLGVGEILIPESLQDVDFPGFVGIDEIGRADPTGAEDAVDLVLLADDVAALVGRPRR
jgi:hypothetical protein